MNFKDIYTNIDITIQCDNKSNNEIYNELSSRINGWIEDDPEGINISIQEANGEEFPDILEDIVNICKIHNAGCDIEYQCKMRNY